MKKKLIGKNKYCPNLLKVGFLEADYCIWLNKGLKLEVLNKLHPEITWIEADKMNQGATLQVGD